MAIAAAAAAAQLSKPSTRSETELWLIGQISDSLSAIRLASKKKVILLFFCYKDTMTVHNVSQTAANDVVDVWAKACIPTRLKKHIVEKVECLFRQYKKLKKNKENKAKHSNALQNKEEDWKTGLDQLFDIADVNANEMMKIEEDKEFLSAQREAGHHGKICDVDKVLTKKEIEAFEKEQKIKKRLEKENKDRLAREETVNLASSCSESDDEQ